MDKQRTKILKKIETLSENFNQDSLRLHFFKLRFPFVEIATQNRFQEIKLFTSTHAHSGTKGFVDVKLIQLTVKNTYRKVNFLSKIAKSFLCWPFAIDDHYFSILENNKYLLFRLFDCVFAVHSYFNYRTF